MGYARHPLRIGVPAAASLLVNALIVAALLSLGVIKREERRASAGLTVVSLAVPKGVEDGDEEAEAAEASAPSPPSAADRPEAVHEPMPLLPAPPAAPPALVMAPSSVSRPVLPPGPAQAPAAAAASSVSAAAAPAAASAPASPARRGAADGLDAKAPAGTSRAYAARVRSWLYAHKIYPKRAKMRREEGVVRVLFVLDRAGHLLEGRILGSSGRASLDEEAMAMMQRASPFPQAPREILGERIEFTAPIEFILPV